MTTTVFGNYELSRFCRRCYNLFIFSLANKMYSILRDKNDNWKDHSNRFKSNTLEFKINLEGTEIVSQIKYLGIIDSSSKFNSNADSL